jgi:hypothetical protein
MLANTRLGPISWMVLLFGGVVQLGLGAVCIWIATRQRPPKPRLVFMRVAGPMLLGNGIFWLVRALILDW